MSQAGDGARAVSHLDEMAIFDALPEPLREALAAAPYDFPPSQFLLAWERSGLTARDYVDLMARPRFVKLMGQRSVAEG